MKIVDKEQVVPVYFVHRDQIVNRFLKGPEGLVVVKVADVLAHEGLAVDYERDCIFKIGTQGQDRTLDGKRGDGPWCVATGATQDYWAEGSQPGDRIVDAAGNWALADQERVSYSFEALQGVCIFVG